MTEAAITGVIRGCPATGICATWIHLLRQSWTRLLATSRRPTKRLRLGESLSLGDRRFVAVVEFEGERFLVGGTSASLVLLTRLQGQRCEPFQSGATNSSIGAPREES